MAGSRTPRMFVRLGLPCGAMGAIALGIDGGVTGAIVGFVLGAALISMVLLGLTVVGHVDRRRQGDRWTTSNSPHQELVVRSEASAADLATALRQAVLSLNATPESDLLPEGPLVARTGMTWKSAGEQVTVTLRPGADGTLDVILASAPLIATTVIDYGKGRSNIRTLADAAASVTRST